MIPKFRDTLQKINMTGAAQLISRGKLAYMS